MRNMRLTVILGRAIFPGIVHITWVISHLLAWLCGLELDDYKSQLYQNCLSEELSIKISDGKLRRQETQDSAFSDEPIIREKRGRLGQQETLQAEDIYQPS